jgi:hypothetical protein
MKTTTTILATLILGSLITSGRAQDCDPDPMAAVGAAMIVGGQSTGGVQQINDNGRNAFVVGDGKGSGVIYQDKGPTYIQRIGDVTFIVPTANPPAGQRNR